MPIEAPPDASTVRHYYGPVALLAPTPLSTDDPSTVGYVSTSLQVYRDRTTATAETDLQTATGTAITTVSPDATTGAVEFYGPVGYAGTMWVKDPTSSRRWPVLPSDLDSLTGNAITWSTLPGRPLVVAAADTAPLARAAIGAMDAARVFTKADVGLDQVTNTSDANKGVSIAQAQQIQAAQDFAVNTAKNYVDTKPVQNFPNFDAAVDARVAIALGNVPPTTVGVPTAPVIGSAVASTTGDPATINLTWSPPTSNGGSVVTGYKVYRADTGLVTQTALSASTFNYQLSSFVVGTSYDVGVSAVNARGEGPIAWSRNLIPTSPVVVPPPASNKPGYPTTVTYTIGLRTSDNTPTITPAWGPPATDGGSPVTGYYVYRTVPGSSDYKTGNLGVTARNFELTNFAFNVSYNVGVSAINANGEGPVFWVNNIVPTSGTVTPPPTGGGGGTGSTGVFPAGNIAEAWYDGFQRPWLGEIPADVKNIYNHYAVGIAQGQGTGAMGWGPGNNGQTTASFAADVSAIHAAGKTIVIGFGGSNGGIVINNLANENLAYNSLKSLCDTYDFDGIEIDLEAGFSVTNVANLCNRLVANYGPQFIIGVCAGLYPGNQEGYLSLAQILGANMTYMSCMLYDFVEAADSRLSGVTVQKIDLMKNSGIPYSKMIMGYFVRGGDSANYANASPLSVADAAIKYAYAQRPGIRGAFIWTTKTEGQTNYQWARSTGAWIRSRG